MKMMRSNPFVCIKSLHLKKLAAHRRMPTALCSSKTVSESNEKTARDYF